MPLLQIQITSFVQTWNNHNIQPQPKRPHLVSGRPFMNYNYPARNVKDFGLKFGPELFEALQDDVRDWDADKYLPPDIYQWTLNQLLQLGFDPQSPPESAAGEVFIPFRTTYLELRSQIQAHIQTGSTPYLSLSVHPTGAFNWSPGSIHEVEVDYDQEDSRVDLG